MYRQEKQASTPLESFKLPFEGKLSEENRWVIMAQWIPRSEFEAEYAELFLQEIGAPAKTFRNQTESDEVSERRNRVKLIADATCVPADITYPTDLKILNNFNESADLKAQIEAFKEYTGYYPESVHVDKIYRTRDNPVWCKDKRN